MPLHCQLSSALSAFPLHRTAHSASPRAGLTFRPLFDMLVEKKVYALPVFTRLPVKIARKKRPSSLQPTMANDADSKMLRTENDRCQEGALSWWMACGELALIA